MGRTGRVVALVWAVSVLCSPALPADELARARKLLDQARAAGVEGEKIARLCQEAYTLAGGHKDGYETAVEAMELLAEKLPEKRESCHQKAIARFAAIGKASKGVAAVTAGEALVDYLLQTAQQAAASGDCASARRYVRRAMPTAAKLGPTWRETARQTDLRIAALERASGQISQYLKRLEGDADDAAAHARLTELYLMERDDPSKAADHLRPDSDPAMRTCLPLVVSEPKDLPDVACLQLAEWFQSLSARSSPAGRAAMLRRARAYHRRLLGKPAVEDAVGKKARLGVQRVRGALAKLAPWEPVGCAANNGLALVSSPAKLPGVEGWTVETRLPRGWLNVAAMSGDDRYVAVAGQWGTIRLFEAASGDLVRILVGHAGPVCSLAFRPGGSILVSVSCDGTARVWDAAKGRPLAVHDGLGRIACMALSPDGAALAAGLEDGTACVLRLCSGVPPVVLRGGHGKAVRSVAWSPDGRWIASGGAGGDGRVCLWSARTKRCLATNHELGIAYAAGLAWSPDSRMLAISERRRDKDKVHVLDVASGKVLARLKTRGGSGAVAWSPDGGKLACQHHKNQDHGELWDVGIWKSTASLPFRCHFVHGLAFSSQGDLLFALTGGQGHAKRSLWDVATAKPLWQTEEAQATPIAISRMGWASDGRWLVCGNAGRGGGFRVWDVTSGSMTLAVPPGSAAYLLAVSPDGKAVATRATTEGRHVIRLWDTQTGRTLRELAVKDPTVSLDWSPDGRRIAVCCPYLKNEPPWVFDAASGKEIGRLKGYGADQYYRLAWSPDGKFIAVRGGGNGKNARDIAILSAQSGRLLRVLRGPEGADPADFVWAPRINGLVSAHPDRKVLAWVGRGTRAVRGVERPMTTVTCSPDGRTVAAGAWEDKGARPGVIYLCDARAGRVTGELRGHPCGIHSLVWRRGRGGSRALASACAHMVRLWDPQTRRVRLTLLPWGADGRDGIAVSGEGHVRATKGVDAEQDLVYVVQTCAGQETLTPAEFAGKYAWENDPNKVGL